MNIIGLAGSPRIDGNSELLLDRFLDGAAQSGASVKKIRLTRLQMQPCTGEEHCFKTGLCQFDDDASDLYEPLLAADMVVLASPVYFYSVSTQAKMLIDRCQALWARRHILKTSEFALNGRGVLIATGASNGKKLFEGLRLTTKYFLEALGKDLAGCLCVSGVDEKKGILKKDSAMDKAALLGRSFAADPDFSYLEGCKNG